MAALAALEPAEAAAAALLAVGVADRARLPVTAAELSLAVRGVLQMDGMTDATPDGNSGAKANGKTDRQTDGLKGEMVTRPKSASKKWVS